MNTVQHEDEQNQKILALWSQYGNAVLLFIGVVLVLFLGYRFYQYKQNSRISEASVLYAQLVREPKRVFEAEQLAIAQTLKNDYNHTVYASLAALILAAGALNNNQVEQAVTHLDWVIATTPLPHLATVARIRLARIPQQANRADDLHTLEKIQDSGFISLVDDIKGDIYVDQSDWSSARASYASAIANATDPQSKQLLTMKLANVPADNVTKRGKP